MHSIIPYEVLTEQLHYRADTLHQSIETRHEERKHLPTLRQEDIPAIWTGQPHGEHLVGRDCGGGEIGDHQHHHRRALGGEEIPCPHRRSPLPNRRAEEEDHDTPYVVSPCYTPGVPAVWGLIISWGPIFVDSKMW